MVRSASAAPPGRLIVHCGLILTSCTGFSFMCFGAYGLGPIDHIASS
jgi:hypothetical protein